MLNFADFPSIDGVDCPCVMAETAVPRPAAQICPSRPEPEGNVAEHDSHPGMFWLPLTVVWDCEEAVTCNSVAEMSPCLSSAITSRVCLPGDIQISVLIELEKAKYTAS